MPRFCLSAPHSKRVGYKERARRALRYFVSWVFLLAVPVSAETVPAFLMKWGSFGTGQGQFSSPQDVAVNGAAEVYVAEVQNHRIQKFTSEGIHIASWGSFGTGNGQFNNPFGIAIDSDGNVYVADQGNHRIQKFDADGHFLLKWGTNGTGNGQFSFPRRVAVDADGNVYVTELANRIQKFSSSGVFLTKWGSSGTGNGQFDVPFGIAVDSNGNVFVCDLENHRIQKFSSTGVFLGKWGSLGSTKGRFNLPRGVFTDAAGHVFVVDTENQRVQQFTAAGAYILEWGSPGAGDAEFNGPAGGTIDANGNVYIAERLNHRIQKFGAAALPQVVAACVGVEVYAGFPARPGAIAFDAADDLYVGNFNVVGEDDESVPIWRVSSVDRSVAAFGPPTPDPDVLIVDKIGEVSAPGSVITAGSIIACISNCTGRLTAIAPGGASAAVLFEGGCLGNTQGLAVDSSGRLYASNSDAARICRVEAGSVSTLVPSTGTTPGNLALDPQGNVYVSGSDLVIRKFAPNGTLLDPAFVTGGLVAFVPSGPFQGLLVNRNSQLLAVDPLTKQERTILDGAKAGYGAVDSHGDLFVVEMVNYRVLKVSGDHVPPSISAPPDVSVQTGQSAACAAVVSEEQLGSPFAFDDCSDVLEITRSTLPAENIFPLGSTTVTYTARDGAGNTASATQTINVVDNTPPTISVPPSITRFTDPGLCTAVVSFSPVAQDNCGEAQLVCTPPSGTAFPIGTTEVACAATDVTGNITSASFTVTVQNPAPSVEITAPGSGSVFAVNTPVEFNGSFTDNPGDVHTAQWAFDLVPAPEAPSVSEPTGTVTLTHTFTAAGVYKVTLTILDQCNNAGSTDQVGEFEALVVVYDPTAGFVTGGGWIQSPSGAYAPSPTLAGKANFAFVSRYARGAAVPSGRTEFQFKVANMSFESSTYEWLVVAGSRAQYKGSGTINEDGDYGFMLTAIDGKQGGSGGDKIRMKIWDQSTDTIVYDNQMAADDAEAPTTSLGAGAIVIHKDGVAKPVAGESATIPTQYALRGNYPDPFNPSTTIEFDLPEPTVVTLTVYDIRGKRVARLADRRDYAAGRHQLLFEGRGLSSGVYFYRLETPQYSRTEKMALMK